jgi:hypothetical protein
VHVGRLLHNNFHARLFWRKYVTTNEAVSSATLLHSLQDFLVNYLAVEAGEVDTLLSPGNRDLLVATVDCSGEGMVGLPPMVPLLRSPLLGEMRGIDWYVDAQACVPPVVPLTIPGVCDRVCDTL